VQYVLFVAIVTVLVEPLGGYIERVFSGTLKTDSRVFGLFLVAALLILAGMSCAPALVLGPALEHLALFRGYANRFRLMPCGRHG
jgi:K+-transporting ATPase A subunit